MSEPTILFVKPGAISGKDKAMLSKASVIVVEIDNPQDARLTRATVDVGHSDLLAIAMRAINSHGCTGPAVDVVRGLTKLLNKETP